MKRHISMLFDKYFDIYPREQKQTQLFFVYNFLLGMFIVAGLSTVDALSLSRVDFADVKMFIVKVCIGTAIAGPIVSWIYNFFQSRYSFLKVVVIGNLIIALSFVLFWYLLHIRENSIWLYLLLVIWFGVGGRLGIYFFFSLAGNYFTVTEGKRVYSYITLGLPVGGIVGGVITGPCAESFGANSLLFLCAAIFVLCVLLVIYVNKTCSSIVHVEKSIDRLSDVSFKSTLTHPFVVFLMVMVVLVIISRVIVEYQFKVAVKENFNTNIAMASFFGDYYLGISVLQAALQLFLVRKFFNSFGVIKTLLSLPVFYFIGEMLFAMIGFGQLTVSPFAFIVGVHFICLTFVRGVLRPGIEVVLLPLVTHIRRKAQLLIRVVVDPIGWGVASGVLALITWLGLSIFEIGFVAVIVAVLTIVVGAYLLLPRYRKMLVASLKKNRIDKSEMTELVKEGDANTILKEYLISDNLPRVEFALDVLQKAPIKDIISNVRRWAMSENSAVAIRALHLLGKSNCAEDIYIVERVLESVRGDVIIREAAITFCKLQKEKAASYLSRWVIDSNNKSLQEGAIIGGCCYCGKQGNDIITPILKAMSKGDLQDRKRVAWLLGEIGSKDYVSLLKNLLHDDDRDVRVKAVVACGKMKASHLIGEVINMCRSEGLWDALIHLIRYLPAQGLQQVVELINDDAIEQNYKDSLIYAIAENEEKEVPNILWGLTLPDKPLLTRLSSGRAVLKVAEKQSILKIHSNEFEWCAGNIVKRIRLLSSFYQSVVEADDTLGRLIHDYMKLEVKALFNCLSWRYDPWEIMRLRYSIFGDDIAIRDNAIELLDSILPDNVTRRLFPVLRWYFCQSNVGEYEYDSKSFKKLMALGDAFRIIALMAADKLGFPVHLNVGEGEKELLDKLIFLGQVELFSDVPWVYITYLASEMTKVEIADGQVIIREGELSDSIYVILDGKVRIEKDGKLLTVLQEKEIIGEMQALDGLSATASCIAEGTVSALQISKDDFIVTLKKQPTILFNILKVITKRFRLQQALKNKAPVGVDD